MRDSDHERVAMGTFMLVAAGLMVACLVGAFVLPPRVVSNKWTGLAGLAGFLIALPFLSQAGDRSRIQYAVEKLGGQIISLRRMPREVLDPWKTQMLGAKYSVLYIDLTGEWHRAVCRTGLLQGLVWKEDTLVDKDTKE